MKTKKKIMVLCSLCGILFLSSLAFAQGDFAQGDVTFSSTPNPVGSGARAIGMGGAFIAIADDATSASWNPAGLLQVKKPEFSIMTGYTYRNENNHFDDHPEASGKESFHSPNINVNYLSIVYPFNKFDHNMAISFSYQYLYDFNREFNYILKYSNETKDVQYSYEQKGSLYAMGFTYCINIPDLFIGDLSIGATFNYWGDFLYKNQWEKREKYEWNNFTEIYGIYDFKGWNTNIGLFLRIKDSLTLGAVIKTPFSADISYNEMRNQCIVKEICTPYLSPYPKNFKYPIEEELKMPLSYGIGISYRFSDDFTMSMDLYKTCWNEFMIVDKKTGKKQSPITGDDYNLTSTTSLHFGAEYRLMRDKYMLPISFGLFYDPAPAKGSNDIYYGLSFGAGIEYNNIFSFYISCQNRYGDNVGKDIHGSNFSFSQNVYENLINSSLVIYF